MSVAEGVEELSENALRISLVARAPERAFRLSPKAREAHAPLLQRPFEVRVVGRHFLSELIEIFKPGSGDERPGRRTSATFGDPVAAVVPIPRTATINHRTRMTMSPLLRATLCLADGPPPP
jgi:hypothetical protein